MTQLENPPSNHSPVNPPENQPSSDSLKPNTNGSNSFPRCNRHSKVMENCIGLFLKFGAAASPTKTLSPKQMALIEQRLLDSFPAHHRPNHPPYAAMIESAIVKLNEKDGSSEEAISEFIRRENDDLPWGHAMFVKHHLDNLCKDGSIFKTCYGLYTKTTDTDPDPDPSIRSPTCDSHSSSNSDSDASVSQTPAQKRRLSQIGLETKMGRLRRMKKEKENSKAQKVVINPAFITNNELWFNELNEEQKLIQVLNAIKRDKKGKVLVERQSEHTGLRSQLAKETEIIVKESGKHEGIVARKCEVAVLGKDGKQEEHAIVIALPSSVLAQDEKQKEHAIVIGLPSSSCSFGTTCSILPRKPVKKKNRPFLL